MIETMSVPSRNRSLYVTIGIALLSGGTTCGGAFVRRLQVLATFSVGCYSCWRTTFILHEAKYLLASRVKFLAHLTLRFATDAFHQPLPLRLWLVLVGWNEFLKKVGAYRLW